MSTHTFTITPAEAGERLDRALARLAPEFTRARLQRWIAEGHIRVDGAPAKASATARAGAVITLVEPPVVPSAVAPEAIDLAVLFEDEALLVLNKPAGMVVHPAAGHAGGTLVNALLHHCDDLSGIGGVERPGIVHRLDKETSGCLVVAKNDAAHQGLKAQFEARTVEKIYLALAAGKFRARSGTIDAAIARHPVDRKKMAVRERGRAAQTDWRVRAELPAGTLVECRLHTGRTHQIRVHLKHLGHPVLGDVVYGKRGAFSRQMLHAWRLAFAHPRTGARLSFVSPIPADFVEAGVPADFS